METTVYILSAVLIAMFGRDFYKSQPPSWARIVESQGESLNQANKRIDFLMEELSKVREKESKCERDYAVLLAKMEMMEARQRKE